MKKALILAAVAIVFCSCKDDKKATAIETVQPQKEVVQTASMDWLLGDWERTNDQKGRATFESWKKINKDQYKGIGYTLVQTDTISKEYMKLEQIQGQWSLFVRTSDDAVTVQFDVVSLQEQAFVCVNEAHDFPTHIAYQREGETLKAKVSNKEMEIDFSFVKTEK